MKPLFPSARARGFSLVELLVVIAIIAILASLLLPALANAKKKTIRINCMNNLKNFSYAVKMWAMDHDQLYPWHVRPEDGGTMGIKDPVKQYLILSNEISNPKILVCPADSERQVASSFAGNTDSIEILKTKAISLIIGTEATEVKTLMYLSGDRNLGGGRPFNCGVSMFPVTYLGKTAKWLDFMHGLRGNMCLADGSVHFIDQDQLQNVLQDLNDTTFDPNMSNCTLIP